MKKKILIAEDDRAILEVVKIILEQEGYETLSTDSAETIYKIARNDSPHLILLDIWLSGHDGGKIAKDLKTHTATKHIPVIMLSANTETEQITIESGADGFLMKPFNIDDLLNIVRKHTTND
jgi:DNA-binding response OmpR family regulator